MPVQAPPIRDEDLHLLLLEQHRTESSPAIAAVGSLLAHLLFVPGLVWLIYFAPQPPRQIAKAPLVDARKAIRLIAPVIPKEKIALPTQTAPNRAKPALEVNAEGLQARAEPKPFQPPSTPRPVAPPPGPIVPLEPPRIEAPKVTALAPTLGTPNVPPPPVAQAPVAPANTVTKANEKPKMAFETPGAQFASPQSNQQPKLALPKQSLDDAIRKSAKPGGGGLTVGDDAGENSNPFSPPSQRGTASSLELLSDPQGVDFKPYLTQILATVRRNWLAVIPESARLEGRRGRVLIQFIVDRSGRVPKLVIATPSGAEALDRAAVTGISASHPFPPLPTGFKGDQVKLQFAFTYNMNR